MKILIIEDEPGKAYQIECAVNDFCLTKKDGSNTYIEKATCISSIHKPINITKFDLIIFDIYLPLYEHSVEEQNAAKDIILSYKNSLNANTDAIVLTQQPNSGDSILFNEHCVVFIEYDDDKKWVNTLNSALEKVSKKVSFDFLIFCALTKERKAYKNTNSTLGCLKTIAGLDCQEITIGDKRGLCIKPTRIGLINMAVTAARAIELFEPLFVGMSGICAGQSDTAKMLDVIICTMAWEYQAGKYQNGVFIQEPYQVSLPPEQQTEVSQFAEFPKLKDIICEGISEHEHVSDMSIKLGPIASGSLVVADSEKMDGIKIGHRKLLGLEMEINALYETANQTSCKPKFLAIKTVTDFGDINKSMTDDFQDIGSIMAARCLVEYIEQYA
jgi:nucleoside phosphorylase